jgi:Rps23 Pro-64 3,4-dihydroxylase Tpa1-like proline 4-hydroxylase
MKDELKSVYYIEIHYNFVRYKIYNVMVKNYEEFWKWLVSGDSDEFTVISTTQQEINYRKDKITNFFEKKGGVDTERSKGIDRLKKIVIEPSVLSVKENKIQKYAAKNNVMPQIAYMRTEIMESIPEVNLESEHIKKYAARLEKENIILKSKISELESKISLKEIHDEVAGEIYKELQQKIEYEKSLNGKQNADLELYKQKVIDMEKTIAEKMMEIEIYRKNKEKVEQELKLEKEKCLNCKTKEMEEKFINICKVVDSFSEEAGRHFNIVNELQQKLVMEQVRANK